MPILFLSIFDTRDPIFRILQQALLYIEYIATMTTRGTNDISQRNSATTPINLQNGSPDSSEEMSSMARTHSLLDEMEDDSSPKTPLSPSKRRRMTTIGAEYGWQGFCRKGTQIKALLDDAFENVVAASTTTANNTELLESSQRDLECSMLGPSQMNNTESLMMSPSSSSASVANIARQKTAEVIILEQKLEEMKTEKTQLQALNNELRENERQQSRRIQQMRNAANEASQNAARARLDADAAETTAATLATQLQALQQVVEETKRASHLLLEEQDEISQKAQAVEQQYVQTQAELARANAQREKIQQENVELGKKTKSLESTIRQLTSELDHKNAEVKHLQQSRSELQSAEDSQHERLERVEKELQQTRALLVDATETAAETEATTVDLKNGMEKLQQANEKLHKQLEEKMTKSRNDTMNHQNELQAAQKENQALKNKDLNSQDEIKQLTADKEAQEKRFSQLRDKTNNLERRLRESTDIVDTTSKPAAKTDDSSSSFSIPPLGGGKENNTLPSCKCTICGKDASGLMKKCQCGNPRCTSRAHATCVNKIAVGPSVSHPGTPAPRLPVVLCGGSCSSRVAAITPAPSTQKATLNK